MKPIFIDEMTQHVAEALDLTTAQRETVAAALRAAWDGKAALVWTRNDIARIADRNGWKRPSLDACDDLLDSLQLETDGVTTATIEKRLRDAGLAVRDDGSYWHEFYNPELVGVATPAQREEIYAAFTSAGLAPGGESLEHARIIDGILFADGATHTVQLDPRRSRIRP